MDIYKLTMQIKEMLAFPSLWIIFYKICYIFVYYDLL